MLGRLFLCPSFFSSDIKMGQTFFGLEGGGHWKKEGWGPQAQLLEKLGRHVVACKNRDSSSLSPSSIPWFPGGCGSSAQTRRQWSRRRGSGPSSGKLNCKQEIHFHILQFRSVTVRSVKQSNGYSDTSLSSQLTFLIMQDIKVLIDYVKPFPNPQGIMSM